MRKGGIAIRRQSYDKKVIRFILWKQIILGAGLTMTLSSG